MNHDHHNHCKHVLAFCEKCDVPYCSKCNFEWAKPCLLWHGWSLPSIRVSTPSTLPYYATTDTTGSGVTGNAVVSTYHAEHAA